MCADIPVFDCKRNNACKEKVKVIARINKYKGLHVHVQVYKYLNLVHLYICIYTSIHLCIYTYIHICIVTSSLDRQSVSQSASQSVSQLVLRYVYIYNVHLHTSSSAYMPVLYCFFSSLGPGWGSRGREKRQRCGRGLGELRVPSRVPMRA